MPDQRSTLRQLRRLFDPSAYCRGLARYLIEQQLPCQHDFTHTRTYFAHYAKHVPVDRYIAILLEGGYHCDCEVGNNLCAELGI